MKTYTISEIVQNPYEAYLEFRRRIQNEGVNAPFPEFKPAVMAILDAVTGARFANVFDQHPDLLLERAELITLFTHINVTFFYDDPAGIHPYEVPFSAPYPYRPTLEAIESGLRLLDKLNRLEPGNRAVPFYHFDRYAYHKFGIFGDPNVIVFPVSEELGFYDLLRLRSVPIGLIGVITETMRVDRHWQSPLDFWYHDINHVRRMCEFFRKRIKGRGITNDNDAILAYYKEMETFIAEQIVPRIREGAVSETEMETAVRRMAQILIFEVVHESALTAEPEVIIAELLRGGGPQPFEHMVLTEAKGPENIEELRTPTGNVASGARIVGADPRNTTRIRYFFDRSLGLLATVYNKLNFGFYDDPEHPSDMVVPVEYRTPDTIVRALHVVWDMCQNTNLPSDKDFHDLITSRAGSGEKYIYKGVLVDDETGESAGTYATDPMHTKAIIKEILMLGKKVILFMGYSKLEYEHPEEAEKVFRAVLSRFTADDYCVCIGATEEGIGRLYPLAKELGFDTIGIVSTLALNYTGKFSKSVDRIYIVNDDQWGGYISGTQLASDTTRVFLEVADVVYAIGGGTNTAVLLEIGAIQYDHTKMFYEPAQMNHAIAKELNIVDIGGPARAVAERLKLPRIL